MNFRLAASGFRLRLMLVMLGLVVLTSCSIAAVMMFNFFGEEKSRAERQLDVAGSVAQEVIRSRTTLLTSSLRVVVEDFGFKSAIASRDLPTITSALENHSSRAGADLAMLVDSNGQLIANLQGLENSEPIPFPDLLRAARQEGQATAMVSWNEGAYQVLIVPVQGGGLRAWLVAGFSLSDSFAEFISGLTRTEVVFVRQDDDSTRLIASSFSPEYGQGIPAITATTEQDGLVEAGDYFARSMTLSESDEGAIKAVLLNNRASTLENYYRLAMETLLLVLIVLLIACVLVLITARALGRPVLDLANFAAAIGENRDASPPDLKAGGELRTLGRTLMSMRDQVRERERRIQHNALHDDLSGLPNRKAVEQQLRQCFEQGRAAVLVGIALSDFKALNETLGFAFGDQTIFATGQRLQERLSHYEDCLFGRTGGNQFMVLLPPLDDPDLQTLIDSLRKSVETPLVINESPINVLLHIGILRLPADATTTDEARRRLNLTMEQAGTEESRTAFYQHGGDESHLRQLGLIRDLHNAVLAGDLYMNYQPKIQFGTAEFVQIEALVRWQHPTLGFINPEEFIRLAERSGQTHALTHYILNRIAADARDWERQGLDVGVAINLSALDLGKRGFAAEVADIFRDWSGRMERLTFEVTESALMIDAATAIRTLDDLRGLGCKLSIDDFGTGYSSLAQLRQLPVQELKIDKSFVLNLDTQPQDQLIVRSTIEMAHGLSLKVVAEGIENLASWHLLQSWGCNSAQGFYLGRPMKAADLPAWAEAFAERVPELAPHSETGD